MLLNSSKGTNLGKKVSLYDICLLYELLHFVRSYQVQIVVHNYIGTQASEPNKAPYAAE